MRKIIYIIIIILCATVTTTGCGKRIEPEENSKTNTSANVFQDQIVDIFEFTNTSLVYEEGKTKLQTTVTNISGEISYLSEFKIHVKVENEIIELIGFVGEELQPKESRVIMSYSIENLTNASSISYEVVR